MTSTGIDELLERVQSKRMLPPRAERRRIRQRAGVSLRDVGAALGVSHTLVRHWETKGNPRADRAAYAELLARLKEVSSR